MTIQSLPGTINYLGSCLGECLEGENFTASFDNELGSDLFLAPIHPLQHAALFTSAGNPSLLPSAITLHRHTASALNVTCPDSHFGLD